MRQTLAHTLLAFQQTRHAAFTEGETEGCQLTMRRLAAFLGAAKQRHVSWEACRIEQAARKRDGIKRCVAAGSSSTA